MADPVTLGVVGGAVLTEGIRFLYRQAEELIKARRERRAGPWTDAEHVDVPVVIPPEAIDDPLPAQVPVAALEASGDELERLAAILRAGVHDSRDADADAAVHVTADELRATLEQIYGKSIRFVTGTSCRADGLEVEVEQKLGPVRGALLGVEADVPGDARIAVWQEVGAVEAGGAVTGATIGRRRDESS